MRLKMAENSLFAILLRSPWWMSLGVGMVVVLAARALLPDRYWPFGAMGAFPFIGIAVVAFARQWRRPSAARTQAIVDMARAMSWRDFAQALQEAFTRDGYEVRRLDGAADFALTRAGRMTLVAARRWKAARHGEEGLAALHAQMRAQEAGECIYVALGELSDQARAFAKANRVQVMQDAGLAQLLRTLAVPAK